MKRNLFLGNSAADTDEPIITLNLRIQTISAMSKIFSQKTSWKPQECHLNINSS